MVGAGEQRSKWVEQRQNEIARSWHCQSWIMDTYFKKNVDPAHSLFCLPPKRF